MPDSKEQPTEAHPSANAASVAESPKRAAAEPGGVPGDLLSASDTASPTETGIYERAPPTGPLQQGELVGGLYQWLFAELSHGEPVFDRQSHRFAVVLSQSCDLEWDHKMRAEGQLTSDKCIQNILLAPAFPASEVRQRGGDGKINSEKWTRLRQNNEERFHFLELVPAHEDAANGGLPELVVDFKQYFSLTAGDLYTQLEGSATRRARLRCPYLEHLATRFFYFQSRVATPRPHFSTP